MADATYQPKVYRKQGGDEIIVADGGKIIVESGGTLQIDSGATATISNGVLEAGDIALASGKVFIGNTSGVSAAQSLSGDATVGTTGVVAIGTGVIIDADINTSAAIAVTKLALASGKVIVGNTSGVGAAQSLSGAVSIGTTGVASLGLASGKVFIGNTSGVGAEQTLSGDASIGTTGIVAIGSEVIVNADINTSAAIAASKLALASGKFLIGNTSGVAAEQSITGDIGFSTTGGATLALAIIVNEDINTAAAIALSKLAIASGSVMIGNTSGVGAAAAVSGDATVGTTGVVTLNAAHQEQIVIVPQANPTAGEDISALPMYVHPRANTIQSIGILWEAASAGIDTDNTSVITFTDDASNTIVTKTYSTSSPPTADYADLGALSTHNVLTAGEHVLMTITNGAAADLPAFKVVIVTVPTNAA